MKNHPPKRVARHVRVPAFAPVPLRNRRDGWTPKRQAAFLAMLALTRSVAEAARRVGMARETAYRLRHKRGAGGFAAAWDAVLGKVTGARRKVTSDERLQRATYGLLKPLFYRGRHVGTVRKPDNSALLGYLAQLDRAGWNRGAAARRSQGFTSGSASTGSAG